MKVIYFHQHFSTPHTGGGIRSYEFAKQLIERGHQVTMVCGGEKDRFNLAATKQKNVYRGDVDGIEVIQIALPYSNNDKVLKRAKTFIEFAIKGVILALRENYDLLFATTTPLTVGIPGIFAKCFRRKKFVFEVRDLWPVSSKSLFEATGRKYPTLLYWALSFLANSCYRTADALISLSPGIKEGIESRCQKGKSIIMIPNGCDLNLFKPGKREDLLIKGFATTDIVAVFTGAHGVANGLNAVLDAAKVLKEKKRNDIKLLFIGEGQTKASLIERANNEGLDNCMFMGKVSKIELSRIISSCDIGMQILANAPFFYYGTSPNKFFDYISSGLPVLTNYPGWIADMIHDNKCGIAVEPNNPIAFAEGLIYLADNPEARKMYGVYSRALAKSDFDRQRLSNQFVDFLEKC